MTDQERAIYEAVTRALGLPDGTNINIRDLTIMSEPGRVRIRMSEVSVDVPLVRSTG